MLLCSRLCNTVFNCLYNIVVARLGRVMFERFEERPVGSLAGSLNSMAKLGTAGPVIGNSSAAI